MSDYTNICLSSCRKVVVERNYMYGFYRTRFTEQIPEQLNGCISYDDWTITIKSINKLFEELEKPTSKSFLLTVLTILTCTIGSIWSKIDSDRRKKKILDFIYRQNEKIFHKAGFHIDNPFECGLRMIQISVLSTGKIVDRIKSHNYE
uniref:Ras modification protein ERF4 n=1 Tax=Strongyloides papillosus TaxID=174720 RepID=A0A0N5BYA2_STREA